jgi:hypothetical protein
VPADFPPIPFHLLAADAPPPGTSLGDVGYRRTVARSIAPYEIAVGWGGDPQATWRSWLGALGRERTRTACSTVHELLCFAQNDSALRRKIEPHQRVIERDFAAMVAELQGLRILTRDEVRRLQPVIRVELIDERGDQSNRLPDPKTLLAKPQHGTDRLRGDSRR